ncbi:MAG: YidC/Oxa1 family membrane protein insertase [Oscillospiraceae bacterium]|nr:YidC/Oxa1 family membrane protein insertase [Oscillospiraceae bacterium]
MEFIREIFSIPFGYLIGFFYSLTDNYILSLLFMTIAVKLVLLPSSIKQQKSMAKSQRLQPKIRRIKEKYANDQRKQQEAMNELYSREGYSSMTGGCLPMLITLPVMMGVYAVNYKLLSYVLRIPSDVIDKLTGLAKNLTTLGKYEDQPFRLELTVISHFNEIKELDLTGIPEEYITKISEFAGKFRFLGMNLEEIPQVKVFNILWLIPILTGLASLAMAVYSYIRQRKTNPEMAKNPSMGCMTLMSPAMSIMFSFWFPASVGIYIIMSTVLSFIQMIILNHTHSPKKVLARLMVDETINHRAKEKIAKTVAETNNDNSEK